MLNATSPLGVGRRRAVVLLAALLAASSCRRPPQAGDVEPPPPPARLVFENQALDQATVYVIRSGADSRRIGTVQAGRTDTLTVPTDMTTGGTVNIVARLLARSIVPQTGPIALSPGDWLRIILPMDEKLLTVLPTASP